MYQQITLKTQLKFQSEHDKQSLIQLLEIERQNERKKQLEEQFNKDQQELLARGEKLRQHRQKAAKIMESRLETELKKLETI